MRRPAAKLPARFKPLFVTEPVPCASMSAAARAALRGALTAFAPVSSSSPIGKAKAFLRPRLLYYGGPILPNVRVYAVRWNSAVDPAFSARLEGFYATFTRGAMFDWLSEYDTVGLAGVVDGLPGSNQRIGHGLFRATYTLTPSATGPLVSSSQISAELRAQILSGNLPRPDLDDRGNVNAIYMIDFPASVQIADAGVRSCREYCAYHESLTLDGMEVPFAVLPAIAGGCVKGCGVHADPFDIATSGASHELVEAVTDPAVGPVTGNARPLAWIDPHPGEDEIGDICEYVRETDLQLDGYWVQREWSNRYNACIVAAPAGAFGAAPPPGAGPE